MPGYDGLMRISRISLAERVPADGRVLVVGAGGGLELEDMARRTPAGGSTAWTRASPCWTWQRSGVQNAGGSGDRVALHHGTMQSAPAGPFDGATCLLTVHFVPREERVTMAVEIRRRLKPGAPFVAVHMSAADGSGPGGDLRIAP